MSQIIQPKRTMNLYQASDQWRNRPEDERFWTLDEMLAATRTLQTQSAEADNVLLSSLEVKWTRREGDTEALPVLVGESGIEADFTHHSFGQMAATVRAPADYLRRLPPDLICKNLNFGLERAAHLDPSANRCLLLRKTNGHYHLGAAVSERYDRIWDADIVERLCDLRHQGWRVPPARPNGHTTQTRVATVEDCLSNQGMPGLSIKPGDLIAPAGLYASDHDMFAFMVNEDGWIESHGQVLGRGFFVSNSEVGDRAFTLTTFLYNTVCGNHIVWGVEDVKELRVIHLGAGRDEKAFHQLQITLTKYAQASTQDTVQAIEAARTTVIAAEPQDVVDILFGRKVASRKELEDAQLLALTHPADSAGAAPNTPWGMAQGLTRLSQQTPHADKRDRLDRAAGKVLKMRF